MAVYNIHSTIDSSIVSLQDMRYPAIYNYIEKKIPHIVSLIYSLIDSLITITD